MGYHLLLTHFLGSPHWLYVVANYVAPVVVQVPGAVPPVFLPPVSSSCEHDSDLDIWCRSWTLSGQEGQWEELPGTSIWSIKPGGRYSHPWQVGMINVCSMLCYRPPLYLISQTKSCDSKHFAKKETLCNVEWGERWVSFQVAMFFPPQLSNIHDFSAPCQTVC